MDFFASKPQFNTLSLRDLLVARDQFHAHLLHKKNVIGTAIGRYLIRKDDPYPNPKRNTPRKIKKNKPARTLENSEVRDYSWPAILVFVSEWVEETKFGGSGDLPASDLVPKTIYLADGRSVPVCVIYAPLVDTAPPPVDPEKLTFPTINMSGGYPVILDVQGRSHFASIGCMVTDGHTMYALTNRHVAGKPGEVISTVIGGRKERLGISSDNQLGQLPFEKVYDTWPGKYLNVNVDVGLIEIDDVTRWSPSIYGIGRISTLADLSIYNLTLNLIGCPVRAYGAASGRLLGDISALFYRYKSVGGIEYVADFLIGSRDEQPLQTRPGDSGTVWVVEGDSVEHDRMPVAVQWGGTVFAGDAVNFPFALATNLSTVCRELEVELYRSSNLATFEYWEAVGHYSIGSFACQLTTNQNLNNLMLKNRRNISYDPDAIGTFVNDVTVPGFVPLANVPDKVWKKKKDEQNAPYGRKGPENPNHYADIDFKPQGGQSLDELTPDAASLDPQTWRDYYHSIGHTSVSERGLVPFRVWQIYKKMVEYVQKQQVAEFVTAAGVLAHYVGDASQPLHGSYLSDGDPFRNKDGTASATELPHGKGYGAGVHSAYEGDMLDDNIDQLIPALKAAAQQPHNMALVNGGQEAGFAVMELMRRSQQRIDPITLVEAYIAIPDKRHDASTTLWNQFGEDTVQVMIDGSRTLAMLWDSAWAEGGGDNIAQNKLKKFTSTKLKGIYEDQNFVPSVPLGQIDQYLFDQQ